VELQPNDVLYVGRGTVHTTSTPAAAGQEQSVHLTVNLDTVAFLFSFKGAMQCGANKLPELAPGGALLPLQLHAPLCFACPGSSCCSASSSSFI